MLKLEMLKSLPEKLLFWVSLFLPRVFVSFINKIFIPLYHYNLLHANIMRLSAVEAVEWVIARNEWFVQVSKKSKADLSDL